jgi:AMMECR1 domain-containing protein
MKLTFAELARGSTTVKLAKYVHKRVVRPQIVEVERPAKPVARRRATALVSAEEKERGFLRHVQAVPPIPPPFDADGAVRTAEAAVVSAAERLVDRNELTHIRVLVEAVRTLRKARSRQQKQRTKR